MAGKKWTVYDVPYLRDDLTKSLQLAERNIGLAHSMFMQAKSFDQAKTMLFHLDSVTQQRDSLVRDDVEMHYISKSMCLLIQDMMTDVPEWTANQALPSERGFLVFEQPMMEQTYATDKIKTKTPTRAIFWHKKPNDTMEIVTLTGKDNPQVMKDADGDLIFKIGLIYFHADELQGSSHQADNVKSNDNIFTIQEFDKTREYNEIVSLIGATWLLMGQRKIAEVTDTHVPVKRSKMAESAAREPSAKRSDVIVHERSLIRRSASAQYVTQNENTAKNKTTRNYTHQWWVRGHWRQQACGPKRAERRPIYIEPHVAGPADNPEKPSVTRWRF